MIRYQVETERLILRELRQSDENGLWELESDPRVHVFLGNKPATKKKQIGEQIASVQTQYRKFGIGRLAVVLKDSGQFAGWSGLKYEQHVREFPYFDLGYRFIPRYWGRGIATESALASLQLGFREMGLDTINGAAHVDHLASNRVLEKSGLGLTDQFTFEGVLCNWYSLSKAQWNKQNEQAG